MKKKLVKLLVCLSMMLMVLSLGACGDDDSSDSSSKNSLNDVQKDTDKDTDGKDTDDKDTDDKDTDKDSDKETKPYGSIKEYVESAEFKAALETMLESYKDQGMDMSVTGEGNKLIYTYKYDKVFSEDDIAGLQDYFNDAADTMESQFTTVAEQLETVIDVKDPIVVIEYIDSEGTEIFTHEYTK